MYHIEVGGNNTRSKLFRGFIGIYKNIRRRDIEGYIGAYTYVYIYIWSIHISLYKQSGKICPLVCWPNAQGPPPPPHPHSPHPRSWDQVHLHHLPSHFTCLGVATTSWFKAQKAPRHQTDPKPRADPPKPHPDTPPDHRSPGSRLQSSSPTPSALLLPDSWKKRFHVRPGT